MSKITNNLVGISYTITFIGLCLFLFGYFKSKGVDDAFENYSQYAGFGILICMIGDLFHLIGNLEQAHAKNKTFTNSNVVYFIIILFLYFYAIKISDTFLKILCLFLFIVNQIIFSVAAYT